MAHHAPVTAKQENPVPRASKVWAGRAPGYFLSSGLSISLPLRGSQIEDRCSVAPRSPPREKSCGPARTHTPLRCDASPPGRPIFALSPARARTSSAEAIARSPLLAHSLLATRVCSRSEDMLAIFAPSANALTIGAAPLHRPAVVKPVGATMMAPEQLADVMPALQTSTLLADATLASGSAVAGAGLGLIGGAIVLGPALSAAGGKGAGGKAPRALPSLLPAASLRCFESRCPRLRARRPLTRTRCPPQAKGTAMGIVGAVVGGSIGLAGGAVVGLGAL